MGAGSPFEAADAVPVAGGTLHVARAGACDDGRPVVLAVHGITASHQEWRAFGRRLASRGEACLLAPDLRGRGRSAALPGPYGIDRHVDDMLAVLEHAGARRATLVGHSMGAYVVARLAAEHPQRAAAVVLVDGGLPLPIPPGIDVDAALEAMLGPAIDRLRRTFASAEEYVAFWRAHPAFDGRWDEDLEAYVRYDLTGAPGTMRSVVSETAVRADGAAMLGDPSIATAVDRVRAPVTVVRAERGLMNDEKPLIPGAVLDAFTAARPDARVEDLRDVNHYTVVIGTFGAADRVADLVQDAVASAASRSPGTRGGRCASGRRT